MTLCVAVHTGTNMMTPAFTRAEYWLLEAVVEQCLPISGLSNGDAAGQVNKSDHQVTQEELTDALDRLFTDGLIIAEQCQSFGSEMRPKIAPTRIEIEAELKRPSSYKDGIDGFGPLALYYRLTHKGAAAWEAFASPCWDHFMDGFGGYSIAKEINGSEYGEAICPAKWKLEHYVAGVRWLGWEIDHNAIVWDTVQPWKATYWKELPTAHRVRFPIVRRFEALSSTLRANMPFHYRELQRWHQWRS